VLRAARAFFFAVPINCIIMAWVIRAMGKIVVVLFPWDQWLGPDAYGALQSAWPAWMGTITPSEGISILIGAFIAASYAMLGGLPSVLVTDVVQFFLAMAGSLMLAFYAVESVGGTDGLLDGLEQLYGAGAAEGIVSFLPSSDAAWLPLQVFLVYVFVQWWAQKFADGGGILVQRMSSARDEHHALRGTAWFAVAHYALRPWPWILVGLVALVVFPLDSAVGVVPAAEMPLGSLVQGDREMAYPVLMAALLPPGLLGVMVAGIAAAFMSTIDTHITWGSSYVVRDLYQRFLRPNASEKELVRVGRLSIGVILIIALAFTTRVESVTGAWKFLTAMGAGLGLVTMARWLWWRINAYSELAGMISAPLTALVLYQMYDGPQALPYHLTLLVVVAVSTAAVLAATLLTAPVPLAHLHAFYEKVRPLGAWEPVREGVRHDLAPTEGLWRTLGAYLLAAAGLFALLFGLGEWLLGTTSVGIISTALGALGSVAALSLAGALPVRVPPTN
jgi:Na+/proline symporter